MTVKQGELANEAVAGHSHRKVWHRPQLARLRAGEAELGANPAKTEQAFAYGS
jgi:hypothetical protein